MNRRYRKQGGEFGEETAWVRCTFWNSQNVFEYLKKGRQVMITGHLSTFEQADEQGRKNVVMEVSVDDLVLTDTKPRGATESEEWETLQAAEANLHETKARFEAEIQAQRAQVQREQAALEAERVAFERRVAALDAALPVEGGALQCIPAGEYQRSPRGKGIGTFPKKGQKRAPLAR